MGGRERFLRRRGSRQGQRWLMCLEPALGCFETCCLGRKNVWPRRVTHSAVGIEVVNTIHHRSPPRPLFELDAHAVAPSLLRCFYPPDPVELVTARYRSGRTDRPAKPDFGPMSVRKDKLVQRQLDPSSSRSAAVRNLANIIGWAELRVYVAPGHRFKRVSVIHQCCAFPKRFQPV